MALVSTVSKDSFNLMLLFILDVGIGVIAIFGVVAGFEFFKILDIVDIIGNSAAPTRHTNFVTGSSGFFLLLVGTRSILRVRVRGRRVAGGS